MLKSIIPFLKYLALPLYLLFFSDITIIAQETKNANSDWKFSVRYVNSENLNLYNAPSNNAEVIDVFSYLKKIVVLSQKNNLSDADWIRVTSPQTGYVKTNDLITEKYLEEKSWEDKREKTEIENALTYSSLQVINKYKKGENSKYFSKVLASEASYVEKVILVTPNIKWFADQAISLWWTEEFDKNMNGYLTFASLNLRIKTTNHIKQKLQAIVSVREENDINYNYYFTTKEFVLPDVDSRNTAKLTIGSVGKQLEKGIYNIKIDIYEVETKSLFASLNSRFSELKGKKFETEEYDRSEIVFNKKSKIIKEEDFEFQKLDNANVQKSLHQITSTVHWGGYTVPVESEFSSENFSFDSKKIYFGGSIEYSKSDWMFGFGLGANIMPEAKNVDSTFFKTNVFYLYSSLSLSYLAENYFDFHLDEDLDVYMTLGATYWITKFQKIKYNGIKENYNIEMDNKGFGYLLGFGATYSISNIIIGLQYQLFHSASAEFSKQVEYETYDGTIVYLTDTYDLYPGYQQIQLLLGYRFEF